MAKKIEAPLLTVRVERELAGEYVTIGETYRIADPYSEKSRKRFQALRFWNVERDCGTFVQALVVRLALKSGALVIVSDV